MVYYRLSPTQLETSAEKLLRQYDAERLVKTKPLDVYAVIEKCLDVPYDWKYLTPDQSYLGMTAFNSGCLWVWPYPCFHEGDLPYRIQVEKGTILIDSTLAEGDNRGRENFTVMHEVFHQVLHKKIFSRCKPNYIHHTTQDALNGKKKLMTAIDHIEYQANACAAAFLMPQQLIRDTFHKCYCGTNMLLADDWKAKHIISDLAPEFNVSKQAMLYRLIHLQLINP